MCHALTDGHAVLALSLRGKIGACTEAAPGACDQERPCIRIPRDLGNGGAHVGDQARVDAVQHLGPVESEQAMPSSTTSVSVSMVASRLFVLVGGQHRASARFMPPDFGRK